MAFILEERCLKITQDKGWKKYGGEDGFVFTLPLARVTHTRTVNKESQSTGPSGVPVSILMGQQPDQVRLEITWNYNEFKQLLTDLTSNRLVNNAANVFLVGSILTKTGDLVDEMPNESRWVVDTFSIRRSINRRGMVIGDLALLRWYRDDV